MGTFSTKLRVSNPHDASKAEELEVLVDTGAAFSWVGRMRLERIGVGPSRRMQFPTIEGRILERDVAIVYVAANGYPVPDLVVMAEPGEGEVLGAHTMEGLGVAADTVQRKLVPAVMLALSLTVTA